jgi:glucose dehydrogenase
MLERETGKPVHPIVEKPVPSSDLIGEQTSPTQALSNSASSFCETGI